MREKDERDSGYIPGSRNIPYRLLACGEAASRTTADRDDLRVRAASRDRREHPRGRGYDARP